jgi:hypothetical protein
LADPATQFQQAGLNIGYQYQPVETRLNPPIQLPGTGELWAKVGQTAMDAVAQAGDMIRKSRLNPEVKAQMNYAVQNYKRGQEIIQHHRALGEKGFLLGRATPQGAEEISPAESGAAFAPLFQPKLDSEEEKKHPPPPAPKHAPGTGSEPQEKTDQEKTQESTSPYGGLEEKNAAPLQQKVDPERPEDFKDTALNTQVPSRGGSTATLTAGPGGQPNRGQPQSSDVEAQPIAAYRAQYAAQHPQGAPAGMFLNPATGNIEPLQTQAPPQQAAQPTTPSPGMFAARPAAAPPPAPTTGPQMTLGATAQPPPGMELAGTEQAFPQDRAALAGWQAQNAHPVMASADALNWAKNFDTGAQRATYLQHGGPNGEPAYAFHMKGGGVNTVPISQIVKNGGGAVVAGQNTSAMLSASDAITNQQPPGQAPGMTLGATAQPPPGMALGQPQPAPIQPGPPPAAPGQQPGQLSDAELQARIAAATNVQSAGGPSLAALTAQAAPQAGTRSTDTPIRPEVTLLSDQEKADFTPEAIAAARANAKVQPNQPHNGTDLDGSGGDPPMGDLGPWHLYRDDHNRTGELYAIRPGLTSLFKQQRYYLGSDGWHEYELPNSNMRLAMEAEYGYGAKGGVAGVLAPSGNAYPSFDHGQISEMSVAAMQGWLAKAARYHNTTGDVNSNMENRFTGLMDMGRRTQRLIDGENIAAQEGTSRDDYTREAQHWSHEAAERDKLRRPSGATKRWNPPDLEADIANKAMWNYHDGQARGTPVNKFSDYLEEQVKRLNDDEGQLPGRQLALQKPGSGEGPSISGSGYGLSGTLKLGSGSGESKSPHRVIERLFEGSPASHADVVAGLQDHKKEIDRQFEEAYDDAITHNFRLSPEVVAYHNALHKHGVTLDSKDPHNEGNAFRDANGNLINPYRALPPTQPPTGDARQQLRQVGGLPRGGATAQPTPGPTPMAEFDNVEDGTKFAKSHKSGTYFKVKGKTFKVD